MKKVQLKKDNVFHEKTYKNAKGLCLGFPKGGKNYSISKPTQVDNK